MNTRKASQSGKCSVNKTVCLFTEEYEDARIAKERFENPKTKIISSKEMRRRLKI